MLLVKDFATGETADFAFRGGIRQPYPGGRSAKGSNRTTSCYTTVTCYWSGHCRDSSDPYGAEVYGTTTYGLGSCTGPGDDGVGCAFIVWSLYSSSTEVHCSPDGSGDPGGDPSGGGGNGGCSGCGPSGPVTPIDPNSPCGQMATLAAKPGFQFTNTQAIAMTQGRIEYGAAYRNGGNAITDFIPFSGGQSNADWPRATGWQYDGMMHTHPNGYSVFSMSDIGVMYNFAYEGYMHDPTTFAMIVYTIYGDDYALKITDYKQFLAFGVKLSDDDLVRDFEYRNTIFYSAPYPLVASGSATNEQSLLRIMRDFNTGLALLKHDRLSNKWEPRVLGPSDTPVTNPCQ